jgi:hypothetical protein
MYINRAAGRPVRMMPLRREPLSAALAGLSSAFLITTVVLGLSTALSIALAGCYTTYQHTTMHLTLQRPFATWGDVRRLYQRLAGQAVISPPDNLTAQVMSAAWCDHPSARQGVVPANRSAACACLYGKNQLFVGGNTWVNGTYTPSVCNAAGDDAVGCLRYRPVWDVWLCGDDCKLHPIPLALTCNLGLTILSLAALMGQFRMHPYAVWAACAVPTLAGALLFFIVRPVQNFLFAMITLGVWAGVVVGLDRELSPEDPAAPASEPGQGASVASAGLAAQRAQRARRSRLSVDPAAPAFQRPARLSVDPAAPVLQRPARPVGIVTCLWFCYPLTLAGAVAYMAVAHTVRDVVGVFCLAALGYVGGLMAQRVHWARCYLVVGADGGGWPLTGHLARALYTWVVRCLGLGLAGVWVALFVLGYDNWLGNSPYAAAPVSLLLLLLCFLVSALELAAAAIPPALGVIGQVGWMECTQAALVLACHTIFAITAMADAAK